ncbi:MAG: hypothetical protein HFF50_01930 [Lawsonibacter sp.]|nr:hypothetical protein [Lawsonibacter sp.]MCI8914164.1 hypothetical protein [Lawsonibacter sp.]
MADVKDLLQELGDYGLCLLNMAPRGGHFIHVCQLTEGERIKADVLYVGSVSQIKRWSEWLERGMFLLVSSDEALPKEFLEENTVLLAEMVQNADILFQACTQWLWNHTKYLEASDYIMDSFLRAQERGLECLADEAALLLRNPLVVLDANCKILAASSSYEVEDELWRQNLFRGYCTYEQIIELQGLTEGGMGQQGDPSQIVSSSFCTDRMCVCPLRTSGERMGTLIVFEASTPFSKLNRKFLSRAASLMTVFIHSEYERQHTLNEYAEDNIFIECLSGDLKSYGSYLERVRNTPLYDPARYRVILIDVEHFENFDPRKEVLRTYFAQLFRRSWMLWYQGNVVCIADVSDSEDIQGTLHKGDHYFREKRLRLGISDCFDNIYYIEQYYRQGVTALRLAERLRPEEYISYYNQYKFYDMLQGIAKQHGAECYLDKRLLDILEYDMKNHTEYYHTIGTYLFTGQNLTKAAKVLHVHKNTVSYRISKAKTLFAFSFDNTEEVFCLMYSYKLKRMIDLWNDENGRWG